MTEPPSGGTTPDQSWASPGPGTPPPPPPPPPSYGMPPGSYGPGGYGSYAYGAPPPPGVVPLRPLGLAELLDGSVKIIRRYPKVTLGLSAVIAVVVTLVNVALTLALRTGNDLVTNADGTPDVGVQFSTGVASAGPGAIVSYLAGLVLTGALVIVVGRAVLGQAITTPEVWQALRPRLWALLGLSLLSGLIAAAPTIVAVVVAVVAVGAAGGVGLVIAIPAVLAGLAASVYLGVRLSLAPAALVLEKGSVVVSLRRSSVLAHGSWWRLFGILLLTGVIAGTLSAVIGVPLGIAGVVAGASNSAGFLVAQQVGAGLVSVIVSPFSAGVHALLYVDRRMRAEGLDVALNAAAVAPSPS